MDLSLLISVGCALFFLCILISIVLGSIRSGISPMPTSPKVKNLLFSKALPSQIQGTIYELGTGWGTLAFPLAKRFPHSQVIGYESSPVPYWISVGLSWVIQNNNLRLVKQDFFQADLHDAALVICYLYPAAMSKLKQKFEKELPPGTWVISNTFAIPGWEPFEIHHVNDLYHSKIFVYKTGAHHGHKFDNINR